MKSQACKGYTLIELLITLSIVGVIFAAGFASFRDFSRRQNAISAVRNLKSDVKLAQEQAIAGKKPEACDTLNYYQVTFATNGYTVSAVCLNNAYQVKQVTLPTEITISTLPIPNPIQFRAVALGTNIASGSSATLIVSHTKINLAITVRVGSAGDIQ